MTASTRAWMLNVAAGWHMAVGSRHVIEYLLSPEVTTIPLAPAHCRGMIVWRDRLVPLVDLTPLLDMQREFRQEAQRALLLGYWDAARQAVRYGALAVRAAPTDITVSDDLACPRPAEPAIIRHLCRSCIVYRDEIIPIMDTARLFLEPLPVTLLPLDVVAEENVHGNGVGQVDGSALPIHDFPTDRDHADGIFVSVPRSLMTFRADTYGEPMRQTLGFGFVTDANGTAMVSADHSSLTAHTPIDFAAVVDTAEGQHPDSDNLPTQGTGLISKPYADLPDASNAASAVTPPAVNDDIETGGRGLVLPTRHDRVQRSMVSPASSMTRATPIVTALSSPRTSPFRESLERRNAGRQQPSFGSRRRAGYVVTVMLILAAVWYGGLIWKSHLPQAGDAPRQTPSLQSESAHPEPVSVPSAPVQPPK